MVQTRLDITSGLLAFSIILGAIFSLLSYTLLVLLFGVIVFGLLCLAHYQRLEIDRVRRFEKYHSNQFELVNVPNKNEPWNKGISEVLEVRDSCHGNIIGVLIQNNKRMWSATGGTIPVYNSRSFRFRGHTEALMNLVNWRERCQTKTNELR